MNKWNGIKNDENADLEYITMKVRSGVQLDSSMEGSKYDLE